MAQGRKVGVIQGGLLVILVGYLMVAALFAGFTPAWQAPDEPAHYTYVAHIAQERGLPVLRLGDYDQGYLQWLLENHFPPGSEISSLRYESHQPPLLYLLATPLYLLTGGNLLALRLFNVVLGLLVLLLLYHSLRLIFPAEPLIYLGGTAFAAFLPMHVAVMAAFNNDGLAEVWIGLTIFLLLRWLQALIREEMTPVSRASAGKLCLLSLVLGLGLITKSTTYILLPIVGLVVVVTAWQHGRRGPGWVNMVASGLWVTLPALILATPLWLRNVSLYGGLDFLGLGWHDQVVVGQPRTGEWINTYGLNAYWDRALEFTFRSFWGVFGWMGVLMDSRIYQLLGLLTGILLFGLLWTLVRLLLGYPDSDLDPFQRTALTVAALLVAGATAGYIWYNFNFVQHQGRYLFPGLMGISLFVALAWREVLQPAQGLVTGVLALVLAVGIGLAGLVSGGLDKWLVLFTGAGGILLVTQAGLAQLSRTTPRPGSQIGQFAQLASVQSFARMAVQVGWLTPFLLLFLLDLAIPFLFLLPQLG